MSEAEMAARIAELEKQRAAQAAVDRGFQKHLDAVKAERDNLRTSFCNAVTRCEAAEAALKERTRERDNASRTAKEMAQAVVDDHARIAELEALLKQAGEALTAADALGDATTAEEGDATRKLIRTALNVIRRHG